MYADDAVILAPSPSALQELVDACEQFACENDMIYNVSKSRYIAFLPSSCSNLFVPKIVLGNSVLKRVYTHKYLGVFVTADLSDDLDIERQIHATYVRGNMLIQKFKHCSDLVKLRLFQTYCINFYCSQLWCRYKRRSQQRLKVAYNNIFRKFMCIERKSSISGAFVLARVDGYCAVRRRFLYSFYNRIMKSKNALLCNIMSSVYFTQSSKCFSEINGLLFIY